MIRKILAIALYLSPALLLGPGCDQPGRICDLICECEHCNDLREVYLCDQINASQDIAGAYDCSQEWSDYADCVEDKGECDEDGASFSTREEGSCSATADSGIPCNDASDCDGLGFADVTCESMTCQYKACAGSMEPCSSSSECSYGEDRCDDEFDDLQDCILDAADDPSFANVDFD